MITKEQRDAMRRKPIESATGKNVRKLLDTCDELEIKFKQERIEKEFEIKARQATKQMLATCELKLTDTQPDLFGGETETKDSKIKNLADELWKVARERNELKAKLNEAITIGTETADKWEKALSDNKLLRERISKALQEYDKKFQFTISEKCGDPKNDASQE